MSIIKNRGMALDEALEVRLFFNHWHHGFAMQEQTPAGIRHSLQFFDINGTAVHKIYLTKDSNRFAYRSLVGAYEASNQSPCQWFASLPQATTLRSCETINSAFARWQNSRECQDFHDFLRSSILWQNHAFEPSVIGQTRPFDPSLFSLLMDSVADQALEISILIGNPGAVQIYSGPFCNASSAEQRFAAQYEQFNLQLIENAIAGAWVVEEVTALGKLASVELHDKEGKVIALIACQHTQGKPKNEAWYRIVNALSETS